MKKNDRILKTALASFWLAIFFTGKAHAYVDPSTTAVVIQVVAGILISLGLTLKIFWQKIIMFFKNMKVKRLQKKISRTHERDLRGKGDS